MQNETQRQTSNKLFILGELVSKDIEQKMDKDRGIYIAGSITIAVNTPVGEGEVKVTFKQFENKKEGGLNSLYKGLVTVANEYKDRVNFGENADTIKVEGELTDNPFYSVKEGKFIEDNLKIKGTFFNRVEKTEQHCCKAGVEGYISDVRGLENGQLEVTLIGLGYGGAAAIYKGIVESDLVVPFQNTYQVGQTATLNFAIINQVETTEVQQTVAFGTGLGEKITRHTRKVIIFGGSAVDFANPISREQVQKAMAVREANLEQNKQKAIQKAQEGSANISAGFGGVQPQVGFGGAQPQTGIGAAPQGGFGAAPQGGFGMPQGQFGAGAQQPTQQGGFSIPQSTPNTAAVNNGFGVPTNA